MNYGQTQIISFPLCMTNVYQTIPVAMEEFVRLLRRHTSITAPIQITMDQCVKQVENFMCVCVCVCVCVRIVQWPHCICANTDASIHNPHENNIWSSALFLNKLETPGQHRMARSFYIHCCISIWMIKHPISCTVEQCMLPLTWVEKFMRFVSLWSILLVCVYLFISERLRFQDGWRISVRGSLELDREYVLRGCGPMWIWCVKHNVLIFFLKKKNFHVLYTYILHSIFWHKSILVFKMKIFSTK